MSDDPLKGLRGPAERIAELEALLEKATEALERIAAYDTDFTVGPAENVNRLQAIAEGALTHGGTGRTSSSAGAERASPL